MDQGGDSGGARGHPTCLPLAFHHPDAFATVTARPNKTPRVPATTARD